MKTVDGNKIRDEIKETLKKKVEKLGYTPRLSVLCVGEDPAIRSFISTKKNFGEDIGVSVDVTRLKEDVDDETAVAAIENIIENKPDGLVVQLPLPAQIPTLSILNRIPVGMDVDLLSSEGFSKFLSSEEWILPPVVGAVEEIVSRYKVNLRSKRVSVVGKGRLVGKPVTLWLLKQGVAVQALEKEDDIASYTQEADVIISGAGSPGLIVPEMVKEGVILIDAGTSEEAGKLKGDIDSACKEKAALFTPVPGGVGPITVGKLFENLVQLKRLTQT